MDTLCKLCNENKTWSPNADRCDRCWDLENTVMSNPALALRVLQIMGRVPQSNFSDVHAFHQKFDLLPKVTTSQLLTRELFDFRKKFMEEELTEFVEAYFANDLIHATDALLDLVYVVLGTAVLMNIPWQACWRHVQEANMRKVRAVSAADSKRGSAYDVVKPAGWIGPEASIAKELKK